MVYGYVRISTKKQSIDRQIRNILRVYPEALIVKEVYTGTKFQGRKEFDKILRLVQNSDTIVFDSVSRMSRNAEEGFEEYERLFYRGINLVFLKEPHIDTATYKVAMQNQIKMTGTDVDYILKGVNEYLMQLAKEQIRIAFEQAEKEVTDLHQRTKEGIETARLNGKQIGLVKGTKLITKKSVIAKQQIVKYNKDFQGVLTNEETWKLVGISKNAFYKYKRELLERQEKKEYG
ncbi:MAG: recombinase family protein [Roseburia inulinivorans]|nr:recombinase family protein [Roseburia inulinivorans]